jgi:hypothetical protein
MDEDVFNMSVRKFLKKVGVTSQREIETAVRGAIADGRIDSSKPLEAEVELKMPGLSLAVHIDGRIELT